MGDGTQFLVRTGDEYEGIFPIWNWRRLPGSVIEQSPEALPVHNFGNGAEAPVTFASGLSDGNTGFFSIQTNREGISSNRSWFCVNGKIVHLMSNLSFVREHDVWHTINQVFRRSDVYIDNQRVEVDSVTVPARSVWQDSVGYYFPAKTTVAVLSRQQSGSWFEINQSYPEETITGEVFTLAQNYGKVGNGQSVCYMICPNVSSEDDLARICSDVEVVSNTADMHCIRDLNTGTYYLTTFKDNLVFRIPGTRKRLKIPHPGLCVLKRPVEGNRWEIVR